MSDSKKVKTPPAGVELTDKRAGDISMYPLDVGRALEAALRVPPPPKPPRKGRKKKEGPPQ